MNIVKSNDDKKSLLTLAGLFLFFFISNGLFLFSTSYAWGADGYYYAAQMRHFWQRGEFFSHDSSLVLRYLLLFSLMTKNYIVSNKIAVLLLSTSLLLPSFSLGKRFFSKKGALLFAGIISANSLMLYFITDYVKNLGGIFFFLYFLYWLLETGEVPGRLRNWILLVLFFGLTLFSHKLMGAMSMVSLGYLFVMLGGRRILNTVHPQMSQSKSGKLRRGWVYEKRWYIIVISVMVIAVVLGWLFFPNVLHREDFSRFDGLIMSTGQWPLSSFISTTIPTPLSTAEASLFWFSPFIYFIFYLLRKRKGFDRIDLLMFVLFGISSFPFIYFQRHDMAFRLFIVIFIPASYFIAKIMNVLSERLLAVLLSLLLIYHITALVTFPENSKMDFPLFTEVVEKIHLPSDSLLICHQGLDNFYFYKTGLDAFRFFPEKRHMKHPVFRLAHGFPDELWEKFLGKQYVQKLPGEYYLLTEKKWRTFIEALPMELSEKYLTWKNPFMERPDYMKRNDR